MDVGQDYHMSDKENGMQIKTILNRIQLHHGFVYGAVHLVAKAARLLLEIEIRPRKGSRPVCSGCGIPGSGYDTLPVRRFEFVPLWGIAVFFLYAMQRVDCPRCGVKMGRITGLPNISISGAKGPCVRALIR